jgi:hypothetical protein
MSHAGSLLYDILRVCACVLRPPPLDGLGSAVMDVQLDERPKSDLPQPDAAFRCKRCRFVLFYGRNVGTHDVGQHRFAAKKEAKVRCVCDK